MNTTTTTSPSPTDTRARWVRGAWLLAGGLGLTALGIAGGLAWRSAPPADIAAPGAVASTQSSLTANEAVAEPGDKSAANGTASSHANAGTPVPSKGTGHPAAHVARTTGSAAAGTTTAGNATPLATQAAAVCATCGVVEGVREVQQKGEGSGLGAVAGGVVGGAVGNQMGHGNGRAAMTLLGAIGGGLAGHEIEKRARSETVYDVRVRMDDGSVRTIRQKTAPTPGSRVTVEGNVLHVMQSDGAAPGASMMRTSANGA